MSPADPNDEIPAPAITAQESAAYIRDMCKQLEAMAQRHNQRVLARLLEIATREAEMCSRNS